MKLDEYQAKASATGSPCESIAQELSLCGMGIAGEAGEVCDMLKKVVHHGRALDTAKLSEELGDVMWYIAWTCERTGLSLDAVCQGNLDKLARRYPNGFNSADSIARRDENA